MSSKDWLEKDYYKTLGVSKNASQDEIKKAFRKLARENHPDQNPGNKKAEARFKEVSEANDVLSDPEKRKEYDQQRSLLGGGFFQGRSAGGASGFEDLFRNAGKSGAGGMFGDIFGGLFGDSASRTTRTRPARRGADIEGEVTIDFDQSISGTTVSIQLSSDDPCKACRGTGAKAGTMPTVCPDCEGSGSQTSTSGGVFNITEPCRRCMGRGLVVNDPCPSCSGSGRGKSSKTISVRVPAGVTDGQRIRIKGRGGSGENGGPSGDLYVVVHVRPHKIFGRSGDDITVTVPITYSEAVLGGEIEVPTLNGTKVKLRVQPGTPNGRVLRIPGRGVHRKDGSRGSQLVTLEVTVPQEVPEEAKAALEAYAEVVREPNPRTDLLRG